MVYSKDIAIIAVKRIKKSLHDITYKTVNIYC